MPQSRCLPLHLTADSQPGPRPSMPCPRKPGRPSVFLVSTMIWQEGKLGTEQTPQASQSSSHQKGAPQRERPHFISPHRLCVWSSDCPLPGDCLSGKKKIGGNRNSERLTDGRTHSSTSQRLLGIHYVPNTGLGTADWGMSKIKTWSLASLSLKLK